MNPIRLSGKNFYSFKEFNIDFIENRKLCIVAPTGSGKTAVMFESLSFVLFKKVRKSSIGSCIRHGERIASIELEFTSNKGENIVIKRTISKDGKSASTSTLLTVDGRKMTDIKHEKDIQEKISEIIGMNYKTFTNCQLLMQNNSGDFFSMKQSEQAEFLIELFDMDRFAEYENNAKEVKSKLEKELTVLEYKLRQTKDIDIRISETKESIKSNQEKKANATIIKEDAETILIAHQKEKAEHEKYLVFKNSVTTCESKIKTLHQEKEDYIRKTDEVKNEIEKANAEKITILNEKIEESKKSILNYETLSATLSKDVLSADEVSAINARILYVQSEQEELDSAWAEASRVCSELIVSKDLEIQSAKVLMSGLSSKQDQIKKDGIRLSEERNKLNDRLLKLPPCESCGAKSMSSEAQLSSDIKALNAEIITMRASYSSVVKEIQNTQELIKELEGEKDTIRENQETDAVLHSKKEVDLNGRVLISGYNSSVTKSQSAEREVSELTLKVSQLQRRNDSHLSEISVINSRSYTTSKVEKISELNTLISVQENELETLNVNSVKAVELTYSADKVLELNNRVSESVSLIQNCDIRAGVLMQELSHTEAKKVASAKDSEQYNDISHEVSELKEVISLCSKTGVPLKMLNKYLEMLTSEINETLENIVDFKINLSTERELAGGGSRNGISVEVYMNGFVDDISCLSGGQKNILRLAFILTISGIISRINGNIGGFLAMDEAITGLDTDSELSVCEMLSDTMKKLNIFVLISHSQQVQGLFDNVMRIEKINGISKIL